MASSRGDSFSDFRHVNPSGCVANSSFSIRSILDLPEENVKKCAHSWKDSSPSEGHPASLPLVPCAVRPMVRPCNVPHTALMNWHQLGLPKCDQHWGYGGLPFRSHSIPVDVNLFPKKRRRPMRKKKQRPLFSPHQIQTMEKEFAKQRYVTEDRRAQLALEVNLTETQVKTWFQNRRTKWKKETRDETSAATRRPSQQHMQRVPFTTQRRTNPSFILPNICVDSLANPCRIVPPYCAVPVLSAFDSNASFVS